MQDSGLQRDEISPRAKTNSAHSEALFVRYACGALDDITFGAQAGLRLTSSSSLTAYIGEYSGDLRQAMENAARFRKFIDAAIAFDLRISGNFAPFEAEWTDPSLLGITGAPNF